MKIERTHLKLYVTDNKYAYKKFNIIDKFFLFSIALKILDKLKSLEKSCINEYKHTEGSIDYKNCMIIQEENFLETIKSIES